VPKLTNTDISRSQELQDRVLELWDCPVEFGSLWHRGVLQTDGTRRKTYGHVHRDIAAHMTAHKRSSLVVTRNHAKSTLGIDIIMHQKWRHPDKRIMHISAATTLSKQLINELRTITQGEIELLPGLMVPFSAAFPELVAVRPPSGAPQGSFNVAGRAGTGREPCFMPSSIGSNRAGMHPTDIIADDPSNERNSTTPVQRQKVLDAMHQLEPILRDPSDGHIWHIGTPWAFKDVSSELPRMGYKQYRFGCWDGVNPDTGLADGKGPGLTINGAPNDGDWPLCPAYMNAAELAETFISLRDAGNYEFWAQQYLVKPVAAADALFDDTLISASTHKVADPSAIPPGKNILLWDPTSRADAQVGDWNGIVLVRATTAERVTQMCTTNPAYAISRLAEMDPRSNIFFVIEALEVKGPPADCMPLVREIHDRQGIDELWVEDTGAASWVQSWVNDHHWAQSIKTIPIKLGSRGASKDRRLQGTQLALKEGRLRFISSAPGYGILTQRLTEFPKSESDDLPDALALLTWAGKRKGILPKISVDKSGEPYYNASADPTSLTYRPPAAPKSW
jgi:hypothetical protein